MNLHRTRRWSARLGLAAVLSMMGWGPASAQDTPATAELLSAIVGISADIAPNARTAVSLGTRRSGSGVVIDANGLIVTVGYVILEASRVELTLASGRQVPAGIVAYDHETGFGLLRAAEPIAVSPMQLGDSSKLKVWDEVLVTSYGGVAGVRPAVMVARREFAGYWEYLLEDAIFTSPPHPLFGGAALLGPDGALLGIGSLVVSDAYRGERTLPGNMFIPVNRLKAVMGDLLTEGRSSTAPRPWLGIYTDEVQGRLFVRRVAEDGPAAAAGIEAGDVVLAISGDPIESMAGFYRKVWASAKPGDNVSLTVLKDARTVELSVTTADRYQWLRLGGD